MLGKVYSLKIQGVTRNDPHPHVVIVEHENDCLLMPCFTVGGDEVENAILDQESRHGLRDPALKVQLDNKTCVTWNGAFGRTGNDSYWLPWRLRRIAKGDLPTTSPGEMCDECLEDILDGASAYVKHAPKQFSASSQEAIAANLKTIRDRLLKKKSGKKS